MRRWPDTLRERCNIVAGTCLGVGFVVVVLAALPVVFGDKVVSRSSLTSAYAARLGDSVQSCIHPRVESGTPASPGKCMHAARSSFDPKIGSTRIDASATGFVVTVTNRTLVHDLARQVDVRLEYTPTGRSLRTCVAGACTTRFS